MKSQLRVRDLMTPDVRSVRPGDDLQTLHLLMDRLNVRHMPVVEEDGSLVGLVSQRDLLRSALVDTGDLPLSLQQDLLLRIKVAEVMVSDVEAVGPDESIEQAARVMLENKYGCLPVVEEARLVGILTEGDFVRFLAGPQAEPRAVGQAAASGASVRRRQAPGRPARRGVARTR